MSNFLQLALTGFNVMRNAREQRMLGEMELERIARHRANAEPKPDVVFISEVAPRRTASQWLH
ncbi:hypothetical protein MTR72_24810 [Bradyrhizobium sp. ISRA442]|uniref:hypothetical protein n=1 Tax=Bradyrhizobium sp. ISRA442 TaxID=2866197 RepID=UPI00311ABEF6